MIATFEPTAIFKKEKLNGYYAICPQVDWVFTEGESLPEARAMIKDVLEGILIAMLEEGKIEKVMNPQKLKEEGDIEEPIELNPSLKIAVAIKIARENSGLSQKKLAAMIGEPTQSVIDYERARKVPTTLTYISIMEAIERNI